MTPKTIIGAGVIALALLGAADAMAAAPVDMVQIAVARTPADHEAIAKAYEDEATELSEKAAAHARMAESYKSLASASKHVYSGSVAHCAALSRELNAAAKESRALAELHHALARSATK